MESYNDPEKTQEIPVIPSDILPSFEEMLPEATDEMIELTINGLKEIIRYRLDNGPFNEETLKENKQMANDWYAAMKERDRRKFSGPVFGFEK